MCSGYNVQQNKKEIYNFFQKKEGILFEGSEHHDVKPWQQEHVAAGHMTAAVRKHKDGNVSAQPQPGLLTVQSQAPACGRVIATLRVGLLLQFNPI